MKIKKQKSFAFGKSCLDDRRIKVNVLRIGIETLCCIRL